jgi:hypothetical protein
MRRVERNGEDDCWPWLGGISPFGYGMLLGDNGRMARAHRIAYEHHFGPIPEGLHIDHTCHNIDGSCRGGKTCPHRRCVNPAHLESVTNRDNILRGVGPTAANARKTHCPRGHAFTPDNLVPSNLKVGSRACLICSRENARAQRKRVRG